MHPRVVGIEPTSMILEIIILPLNYTPPQVVGIEPTLIILKTIVLPLNYTFWTRRDLNSQFLRAKQVFFQLKLQALLLPTGLEPITNCLQNNCSTIELRKPLDKVGFEPTIPRIMIFKTTAFNHSATCPIRLRKELNLYLRFCRPPHYHYATQPISGRQDLNL